MDKAWNAYNTILELKDSENWLKTFKDIEKEGKTIHPGVLQYLKQIFGIGMSFAYPIIHVIIMVPENFEIENGLLGLKRDILLRICHRMDGEKIRTIIGVCNASVGWNKNPYFRHSRIYNKFSENFEIPSYGTVEWLNESNQKSRNVAIVSFTKDSERSNEFQYSMTHTTGLIKIDVTFDNKGGSFNFTGATHETQSESISIYALMDGGNLYIITEEPEITIRAMPKGGMKDKKLIFYLSPSKYSIMGHDYIFKFSLLQSIPLKLLFVFTAKKAVMDHFYPNGYQGGSMLPPLPPARGQY